MTGYGENKSFQVSKHHSSLLYLRCSLLQLQDFGKEKNVPTAKPKEIEAEEKVTVDVSEDRKEKYVDVPDNYNNALR